MKRQTKGNAVDIRIRGDELEYNRIQLEHNLQNTELSFHLSSTSDEENGGGFKTRHRRQQHQRQNHHHHHNSSLEYPRHISEPINELPSFTRRSAREHFGEEDQMSLHPWSYRTADDEDGVSPYGGATVSTVGHHASALTITAGLGGGRHARRDPSVSGAEYDPERPLDRIIAGVNGKYSMFDDASKTPGITYDPLVVDTTAELDRILESGHAPQVSSHNRSVHPTPPTSSGSASDSDGGPPHQSPSRPRLTDHLRHVSFSPKRPRTAPIPHSNHGSPLARPTRDLHDEDASMYMPTPKPVRRANISAMKQTQPDAKSNATAASNEASRFTRMARGINKEIQESKEQLNAAAAKNNIHFRPSPVPEEPNPFHDPVEQSMARGAGGLRRNTSRRSSKDITNGKIHLPDVTGLTSAVESPAKPNAAYHPFKGDGKPRDTEARLLQTMNAVQNQLRDLEEENGISRRRVRELEMELEECKREVARERTRLFEREESEARQYASYGRGKGKGRAAGGLADIDDERLHARYKEAVDEKKALEALINSLRSHLTRLTTELSSHQDLLSELKNLRDSDSQLLKDKSADILQLKEEVQRLAGEVEVLRGVVEEGLKERRASREVVQVENSAADVGMSQDLEEEESVEEQPSEHEDTEQEEDDDDEDEEETQTFDSRSLQNESSPAHRVADRTMRTDHATIGSTHLGESTTSAMRRRSVGPEEDLGDVSAEIEERRSDDSIDVENRQLPSPSPGPGSPVARKDTRNHRATVADADVEDEDDADVQKSIYSARPQTRPSAPTPSHATRNYNHNQREGDASLVNVDADPETPFPQIRGEQLERLFFSAPEHNPKTCTVCYRRRGRTTAHPTSSWSRPRAPGSSSPRREEGAEEDDDEGYEGSEGAEAERFIAAGGNANANNQKGKEREWVTFSKDAAHWQQIGRAKGLPGQTVVARVIRELEDDFTHYKSIYVELADQYKVMDAASDVPRRNLLARHLREVVDVLEQKGDQIASLYDLLQFKDKELSQSVVPEYRGTTSSNNHNHNNARVRT
ncbi:hypothetical protein CPC08DRAFT_446461 [Agrocybe pediades]|nr:hypothetical protein CPC08DRAFT_446461 [Agrocybe pediades]